MSRYDYACPTCGHEQEEMHSIKESPSIMCKNCGHKPMFRQIGSVPFHLKGRGWSDEGYSTSGENYG